MYCQFCHLSLVLTLKVTRILPPILRIEWTKLYQILEKKILALNKFDLFCEIYGRRVEYLSDFFSILFQIPNEILQILVDIRMRLNKKRQRWPYQQLWAVHGTRMTELQASFAGRRSRASRRGVVRCERRPTWDAGSERSMPSHRRPPRRRTAAPRPPPPSPWPVAAHRTASPATHLILRTSTLLTPE